MINPSNCILDIPLTKLVFVAFDVETTGLNPAYHSLVEISGVKFIGSGKVISTFSALINPEIAIPEQATAIHGITNALVASEPPARVIIPQFLAWLTRNFIADQDTLEYEPVLIAHNARFDMSFLTVAVQKLQLPIPTNLVLDTLSLSRRLLPEAANHQLRTLTEYLEISSSYYHRALADSQHVCNLFNKLVCSYLPVGSVLADIVKLCGELYFDTTCISAESSIFAGTTNLSLEPERLP